ncbi:MAG TPA: tRNA adenosine(34) deaminase TadA [Bacillota bacterium]|nr:tRNA adenosine(34) deaminase TadA [Bacillota bacterium]HQQ43998.1 tRNA adenosine(34) deaminase TadA [Bacillota bacterium]
MRKALEEAEKAFDKDEVPVGAVIVRKGEIIAAAHNCREILKDATAHAEILAIKEACEALGGWRLIDCDMYVTLEPCVMCSGAILQARIERLYIGAMDPKGGAAGSMLNLFEDYHFNHRTEVIKGILEEECSQILKDFFKKKR